ncbi:MAG: decarboxylating 6-phosphogluconate dehydrogenase [Solirubrobacteraceae bacterium]|nr:decarboxylating 6-phosphogluconate dehydrogenase [Solirubrobacteraceae bacterium]
MLSTRTQGAPWARSRLARMQLGLIGLGKMGGNMARRLRREGDIDVIAYDRDADAVAALADEGVRGASSLEELVAGLDAPRYVWVMVPAGAPTTDTVNALGELLSEGDVIIDGGNSRWTDDEIRKQSLTAKGIGYMDVGTSGGVWGLQNGYCMMVGGEDADVAGLTPVLNALAPVVTDPEDKEKIGEYGWEHVGPTGSGHFVKMVHNGIEYGLMQAYAEGYALLAANNPDLDLERVARLWQQGSVVRSWLNELMGLAFAAEGSQVEALEPVVNDSGEGRWTIEASIDLGIPTPVMTLALQERFVSRGNADHTNRMLSALRNQFGGHEAKRKG